MSIPACRFCREPLSRTFCDLGGTPLSNGFLAADQLAQPEPVYPLHARVCGACYLVQVEALEAPASIFDASYPYFSSYTEGWVRHAQRYVEDITARLQLHSASRVIEIASNDGYLLQFFVERGIPALGIEPAANCAAAALAKGVASWQRFFDSTTARKLVKQGLQADLLIGNNVLAHVHDLNGFVAGLRLALKPGGTITLEFPHLLQLVKNRQFDTIYHEHFSYFSLGCVQTIFRHHRLEIVDVDELPTHGGSLRVYVKHTQDAGAASERVAAVLENESGYGLHGDIAFYEAFDAQAAEVRKELLQYLLQAKSAGRRVAAYGAAAKGNTLLNYCDIDCTLIEYVADISPHKQGKYLPGSHIPVYSPDYLLADKPDVVLILPWNIKDEVVKRMAAVREWGGTFVTPIPSVMEV